MMVNFCLTVLCCWPITSFKNADSPEKESSRIDLMIFFKSLKLVRFKKEALKQCNIWNVFFDNNLICVTLYFMI